MSDVTSRWHRDCFLVGHLTEISKLCRWRLNVKAALAEKRSLFGGARLGRAL